MDSLVDGQMDVSHDGWMGQQTDAYTGMWTDDWVGWEGLGGAVKVQVCFGG